MVNNIDYVFWGTKRGEQLFLHSDGLSTSDQEIQDTLKDVRTYFRSPDVGGENYYAIEYTQQQIVYTLYYTLYDWGNRPGFMAVTIYVPKNVQLVSPVSSLQTLFITYKEKYIGANYKITEERERKSYFDEIVSSFQTQSAKFDITPSPQNRKYGVEYFKSDGELEDFFTDPIRKEYFDYQEVLFLPESLRKDYQSLTPLNGTAKRKYNLEITLKGHKEESLSPEGLNVFINKKPTDEWIKDNKLSIFPLSYQDQIEISFQKERYEKFTKKYKVGDLVDSKEHCVDGKTIKLTEKIEPIKKNYTITLVSADGSNRIKRFKYRRNNQELSTSNPLNLENVLLLDNEQITFSAKGYEEKSVSLADNTDIIVSLQPVQGQKKSGSTNSKSSSAKSKKIKRNFILGFLALLLLFIIFFGLRYLSSDPTEKKVSKSPIGEEQAKEFNKPIGSDSRSDNRESSTVDKIPEGISSKNTNQKSKDTASVNPAEATNKKDSSSIKQTKLDQILEFANGTDFDVQKIERYKGEIKAYSKLDFSKLRNNKNEPYNKSEAFAMLKKRLDGMLEISKYENGISKGTFEKLDGLKLSEKQNQYIRSLKSN